MLKIKSGVHLTGLRPEMTPVLVNAATVFGNCGVDAVITAGVDGSHSRGSLHYVGLALDFRLKHIATLEQKATVLNAMLASLGALYDVVWEDAGGINEHLHVEYQPKQGANK